jgi:hypothetical protein
VMVGARLTRSHHAGDTRCPLRHFPEQVECIEVTKVGCRLGLFWAKLGLGPKIKVEAHKQLYTFHLKCKVILSWIRR